MLYDNLAINQVVDSESALEFMKEATRLAKSEELAEIGDRLMKKSRLFSRLLREGNIKSMSEDDFNGIGGAIFGFRRKYKRLIAAVGFEELRCHVWALLYGPDPVERRFDVFLHALDAVERRVRINLASELLHFTHPEKHWLWTNWIWDPATGTGALPLVTDEGKVLSAETDGETYLKVGEALRVINAVGHARSLSNMGPGLFGTDVFLACVYAIYMYTVFKVKLSREFNRILPELPELTQRVLGVHKMQVN